MLADYTAIHAEPPHPTPLSDAIVGLLSDLGVDAAFGILGGSIAPLYDALGRSPIRVVHCRHESAAAFAAVESNFASGRPAVAFATGGPGLVNAVHGIAAARWEGAKTIFLTGTTPPLMRGRWAFQETSDYTMPGFFTAGSLFDYAVNLEDAGELHEIGIRLRAGLTRPGGFVAAVGVPVHLQRSQIQLRRHRPLQAAGWGCEQSVAAECAQRLAAEPFVIWVGFGARHAAASVRALAERTGALVMSTPRGKGIFPEDHPQYLGVTGVGGHAHVGDHLAAHPPARVLVLGSRLAELSSHWDTRLLPRDELIHVDVDPSVPGTAFPAAPTYAVHADVGAFLAAVLRELPETRALPPAPPPRVAAPQKGSPSSGRIPLPRLFEAIQRRVVEGSDAVVLGEAGNTVVWAIHSLRFDSPRFRASTRFGSMGHAGTGVIGAAVGRRGKAVALVGDASMLMFNEINTAVTAGIPAVWIVLNNARYGMTHAGMKAVGFEPRGTEFEEVDFAGVARAMRCAARRVNDEAELDAALDAAMRAEGPFLIDVLIDPEQPAPGNQRNQSLREQWRV
jgi:acetolactate synthase-1/2/3 large subunit